MHFREVIFEIIYKSMKEKKMAGMAAKMVLAFLKHRRQRQNKLMIILLNPAGTLRAVPWICTSGLMTPILMYMLKD